MITFKDKIKNIIENKKSVTLRFLSLSEQQTIKNMCKDDVILYGGYEDAERKRAVFYDNDITNIICYQIIYNQKYLTLSHQNILGTLLSLSITIDSIGDILPKQGLFFITKEIEKEITSSFTKINNVVIELIPYFDDVISENEFQEYTFTTESLRLDLVVSKITKTSRSNSSLLITKELVKLNHLVTTKNTKLVNDNDIISIRKYGRFKVIDTSKKSKKGKIVVKYAKYI